MPRSSLHHPYTMTAAAAALCAAFLVAGCAPDKPAPAAAAPQVSVVPALQREVQEFDEFTARLEAPDTVEIRARVAGALHAVHFREGQLVRKGDALFTIDPRPFAAEVARAEAQASSARTQAELSRSDLARAERLVGIQGVSQQEVEQLRAAASTAQSAIQAADAALAQARLNLEFTRITAPVAGRTSRANVTPGNLVGIGDPVLTSVVSNDKVYAYFDASEATYLKYAQAAREGTRASGRETAHPVTMALSDDSGFVHQGHIDFVDNRLNPTTGTIRGRAVFDNKEGHFTPGLFARVKLVASGLYPATLVPERAITTDQTRKVVLVVGADNVVSQREVKPGALIEGMRVVQGVKPGEQVIVEGLLRASPGAPVTPNRVAVDERGLPVTVAKN
ncbi:efflux RND transporter periplasmic adaptor subunit [Caldimonas sp. KR1-144]|uniref:efflux RND transporter periplasmic adaptor subunit n=1 Tax=Caldimonas sp. KR1-144 TaxID=3400911 RepID=UPI003BFC312C